MVLAAILTAVGMFIIGIIMLSFGVKEDTPSLQAIGSLIVFFSPLIGACTYIILDNLGKPTALDVYQGKTTLQVTYQDSVPVDSVVVFKTTI